MTPVGNFFFDICGRLTGRKRLSPLPTSFPSGQLPQVFCDFFTRLVSDIRSKMDLVSPAVIVSNDSVPPCSFLSFQSISETDLKAIILKSKPTTCPLDPIPTHLFVECLDLILPHVTQIVNQSLSSGVFPTLFKNAIVKPLLKKPSLDQNILKNYRPVSNLSFLSKIMEKVVLKQLLAYLNTNDLMSHSQSAYRPAHSTETTLVKVTNDLLKSLDEGNVSVLTLLDLSAAFDTIDHVTLLRRLNIHYGISGSALSWFKSYLLGRTLTVLVDGQTSTSVPLTFGVPQGSVLGPVLFTMYTEPLSTLIQSHSVSSQSFADDTQLYDSTSPDKAVTVISTIETCITDVKTWMVQNKLKLNDEKTEALLFKKKTTSFPADQPSSLRVGDSDISFVQSARNLGFTVTSDMSLDKHISNTCRSAYFELRKIGAIRQYLSVQTTNTLVCAFVLSKLDYCNALLSGCPLHLLQKLQKVMNSAARLVLKARKRDHATPLLRTLHWLPVKARIEYKLCTLCFNYFSGSCPSYFSDLLTTYTPRRQLRSSSDSRIFSIPKVKTKSYGERSFSFCAPSTWNSLPHHIRHIQSLSSFKRTLKTYLFQKHFS